MIKQEILSKILIQKYFEKQNAELLAQNNLRKAMKNQEYEALENKKKKCIFELGKAKFENQNTKKLEDEFNAIISKQSDVLKKIDISPESLLPIYSCKECNDTGYSNGELCNCVKQKYFNELMHDSKIEFDNIPLLDEYTIDCFDNKEQANNTLQGVKQFIDAFESSKIKNIVFCGKTGVGKTYLAKSIAKTLIKKGYPCLFVSAFNLNNYFLKIHTSKQEDKLLEFEKLINPELLIIDDLGTEQILRNVTIEYLLMLVCERINLGKKTIFTTNLMPNDILDKYAERLFSRIFDKSNSTVCNFTGKDLRISK